MFGRGAAFQVISPHFRGVPLQIPLPPWRPPALLPLIPAGGFQMTKDHTAPTASGRRHFRPRPAELQAPAAPAQGPPYPTSAQNESQNPPRGTRPRNRTKPADGGGGEPRVAEGTGDGGFSDGAESPIWLSFYSYPPPNCWTRRPRPVLRASREAEEGPRQASSLTLAKRSAAS